MAELGEPDFFPNKQSNGLIVVERVERLAELPKKTQKTALNNLRKRRFLATIENVKLFETAAFSLERVLYLFSTNSPPAFLQRPERQTTKAPTRLVLKNAQVKDVLCCFSKTYLLILEIFLETAENNGFVQRGNWMDVYSGFETAKRKFVERDFQRFLAMLKEMTEQKLFKLDTKAKLVKFCNNLGFVKTELKPLVLSLLNK